MYTLVWSDETHEYDGRQEAVAAAKELSDGKRNAVSVLDDEEKELLEFRDGQLAKYLYETRPGKTVRG